MWFCCLQLRESDRVLEGETETGSWVQDTCGLTYSGPGKTTAQWERADGRVQIRQAKMRYELCAWHDKDCSWGARPVHEVSQVRNTWCRITCNVKHREMIKLLEGKPNCTAIGCEQLDCLDFTGQSHHLTRGPLKEHGWLDKAELRMFSAKVGSKRVLGVAHCGQPVSRCILEIPAVY